MILYKHDFIYTNTTSTSISLVTLTMVVLEAGGEGWPDTVWLEYSKGESTAGTIPAGNSLCNKTLSVETSYNKICFDNNNSKD